MTRLAVKGLAWLAASLILAGGAAAQPGGEADDVVVVTGTRSGEAANATILPVTRIDAETRLQTSAHHPSELLARVPGVRLHRGNGAEHLTAIRSPVLTGGAGAGAFLFLEDGIPLRAAGFANVNGLFEALTGSSGGVEVVRGPGSALQGSNGLHGVVNFLTPSPAETADGFEAELGSFGRRRGRMVIARPGDTVSALFSVAGQHEDGWRDAAGLDRVEALVRIDGETPRFDWRATAALVNLQQETAGFVRGPDAYRDLDLARSNDDPEAFRDAQALRLALTLNGQADARTHWQVTPYARANEMDFLMHFVPSEALEESGHSSVGVLGSITRQTGWGEWVLGADVEASTGTLRETQSRPTIFSFIQGEHYDYAVDSALAALYGQGQWSLSDALRLQAGLRLERIRYDYDNRLADDIVGRYQRVADRGDAYDLVLPHLGISWQIDPSSHLVTRLARGARAPQTAELYRLQPGQVTDGIEPETLDSFEVGYRRAGVRLDWSLTAFAMQKRNVFFRDADGFNVTGGKTRHHGLELALEWQASTTVTLDLAGSWARHLYDFDQPVTTASETIRAGAEIDTAPQWLWNARARWQPTARFSGELEWSHMGRYFTDAGNLHTYGGHDLVHLRARYQWREDVEVFASVRNLLDTRYAERADFAFGSDRYFPGEERGVNIGVRVGF
ncbi:TonB-dependent receptor [Maricaulis sp.]|uniref:TonB-dependent receptor n=1 Tax=Maricaulis sp. TaxID=1486257 RepID=UPI00262BBABE|nr:TonB-dependent receptor [Maricaulis sp.]MDF1768529.1 TonB-dependent receptor [Maricaulis sp.]